MNLQSILLKYWGFKTFRPLQEDIIRSVLDGHDTVALMPTGGGKSLCYQVPAMAKEGLCIVVTPLIALMKDQVQALRSRGIKAVGVHHGLSRMEIDVAIDNCVYGDIKFLYLSPERLITSLVRARLPKMKVNLLAIDEAHCISQWGHDFRPPYLRISEVRELMPGTPLIALTATATPKVVHDIQENLMFVNQRVFQKSFERKNLAYIVLKEDDKLQRLLKICKKVQGTGIVYVRNRRKTRETAEFLKQHHIRAEYYHAGLSPPERDLRQQQWMKEQIRVIVATNAFGMGIDKGNVSFVVHLDLPDTPEAYFQEAGRAGRDGQKAFAVLLFNNADILNLQRFHELSYPPLQQIRKIYNCLGNYLQLAKGSGKDQTFSFDLHDFCSHYTLEPVVTFNALRILEKEGLIALSEAMSNPSRMMVLLNKEDLYGFQVANPSYDNLMKVLLRSYSGLFSEFSRINEQEIARRTHLSLEQLDKALLRLHQMNVIYYQKQNQGPILTYLEQRFDAEELHISPENYKQRKLFSARRLEAITRYVQENQTCRSQLLLEYFGEQSSARCGHCDVCLERNKLEVSGYEFDLLVEQLKPLLLQQPLSLHALMGALESNIPEDRIIRVIRWLGDNQKVLRDEKGNLFWNNKIK
ncbi:MAG: ATP-dependent DNA helicase RecQ [Bacteroidales bacterium]